MSYNKKPFEKGRDSGFKSGGDRGGDRGGHGGSRGGDRGGDRRDRFEKPSGPMTEIGSVLHPCEDTVLCQITLKQKLPFPSAIIYLGENQKVGRVDEVLGPLDDVYLSIKLDNGILPSSIKPGQKIFTTGDKIMLASRVTEPKKSGGPRGASKPKGGPAQFGNRGGDRGGGGRGGRGGARGGFGGRGGRGGSSGGRR